MKLRHTISVLSLLAAATALSSCGSSHSTHLLYVSTGQGIYGYRLDNATGAANVLPSAPFIVGNTPAGMVIDSSGQRGYVANQSDNTVSLINIDSTSGVVSEVLPRVPTGGFSPQQLLLDEADQTLFVTNLLSNSISTFSVGASGGLTPQATTPFPDSPSSIAFAGGLLFATAPNLSRVYVYSVSSGNLTPLVGSPIIVPEGVGTVTVDPSAKYLYVTNPSNNSISGYSIQFSSGSNQITLTLIPGSPFASSTNTVATAPVTSILDSTATHLYVANSAAGNMSVFSVGTNGSLTATTSVLSPTGTNPRVLAFDPVSTYLLVGNLGSRTITEFSIKADATLSSTGQTVNLSSVPQAIAATR
ncbi:MAG TPA: beta-propeller fold lactonase family protein [Terriglobales bacterium]|jgi:6-phosphogluconolactonase (cycloisomerase 2 family)|nr:beta-propeller fold lactonase family protein [Terriglobales bacterium]